MKCTGTDKDEEEDEDDVENRDDSEAGGGPHTFPSKPMDRARASWMLYSTPSSVNSRGSKNRSFSGRFPGAGGASISAYREAGVELKKEAGLNLVEDEDVEGEVDGNREAVPLVPIRP